MRDLDILLIHLIATLVKLLSHGGARSVVAESVLLKHLTVSPLTYDFAADIMGSYTHYPLIQSDR